VDRSSPPFGDGRRCLGPGRPSPWVGTSIWKRYSLWRIGRHGSEAVPYAWDCPEGKFRGYIGLQVRLIDRGIFPEGPLRIAVIRPDEPFLLYIYELYPASEGHKKGTVKLVDRLVPREEWNQAWLRVTNLEEEMRRIYFNRSVLQKLRDLMLGIDMEAALQRDLQQKVKSKPRGMTLFYHPEEGFFLATQSPLTLTHVDPKSRSFQILPARGFGPLQPISLLSSLPLAGLFHTGKDLWGFVTGSIFETESQYNLRHPDAQPCRFRDTLPDGQAVCTTFVDLVVRIPRDTLDMAEWWILHEWDGRHGDDKRPKVWVLRVDGNAVEYLETILGQGTSSTSITVKRKFFR